MAGKLKVREVEREWMAVVVVVVEVVMVVGNVVMVVVLEGDRWFWPVRFGEGGQEPTSRLFGIWSGEGEMDTGRERGRRSHAKMYCTDHSPRFLAGVCFVFL